MASQFTFDSQIVSQCVQDISTQKAQMQNLMNQATSVAARLAGSWTGDAGSQFQQTFNAMKSKLEMGDQVIAEYITFLNEAISEYEAAERSIQSDVASFDGGN